MLQLFINCEFINLLIDNWIDCHNSSPFCINNCSKSYLCSTMGQDRLKVLTLMYTHKDILHLNHGMWMALVLIFVIRTICVTNHLIVTCCKFTHVSHSLCISILQEYNLNMFKTKTIILHLVLDYNSSSLLMILHSRTSNHVHLEEEFWLSCASL